jgi:hypothetical protein
MFWGLLMEFPLKTQAASLSVFICIYGFHSFPSLFSILGILTLVRGSEFVLFLYIHAVNSKFRKGGITTVLVFGLNTLTPVAKVTQLDCLPLTDINLQELYFGAAKFFTVIPK